MAVRGAKPKPAHLRLIEGNPGKRPITPDPAADLPEGHDNGLEPPRKLKKRQQELWNAYIRRAGWLTAFDVPRAFMWVELHAEFERAPTQMIAGKIAQLRSLGSELGLDPGSRARLNVGSGKPKSKFSGLLGGGAEA